MAEAEVGGSDAAANRAALVAALAAMGARAMARTEGVAGAVDATVDHYRLPDGGEIELWSDNYIALSMRGEPTVMRALARAAGVELVDG